MTERQKRRALKRAERIEVERRVFRDKHGLPPVKRSDVGRERRGEPTPHGPKVGSTESSEENKKDKGLAARVVANALLMDAHRTVHA